MIDAKELLTPMVADRPDAVFIMKTHLQSMDDEQGVEEAGYTIARAVFRGTADVNRTAYHTIIKPNVVDGNWRDKQGCVMPTDGVVTDTHFVGGIARFMREVGFNQMTIAEGGDPTQGEDGEYTVND